MVLHKHGEMLYDNVKKTTADMLQPIAERIITQVSDDQLLVQITRVWDLQKQVMQKIRDILLYLDKNYVTKQKNMQPVYSMQTNQFKNHVILKGQIKKRLVSLLLSEIEKERNGHRIERVYVSSVIEMLIEVGMQSKKIYEQEFESALIQQTRDYYRNEATLFVS
jgi:cullin 3